MAAKSEGLCQRILRESGFFNVAVPEAQLWRWRHRCHERLSSDADRAVRSSGAAFSVEVDTEEPGVRRSFKRTSAVRSCGRVERGLGATTGVFTREARREACRDGAPPINLVERDLLLEKLKQLKLGIELELVESVSVNDKWFENL